MTSIYIYIYIYIYFFLGLSVLYRGEEVVVFRRFDKLSKKKIRIFLYSKSVFENIIFSIFRVIENR